MKKKHLLYLLFLSPFFGSGQICVGGDCKDTIQLPQDTVTLSGTATSKFRIATTLWIPGTGFGSIDNPLSATTVARKMDKAGWYSYSFRAIDASGQTGLWIDSVLVLAAQTPACPVCVSCPPVIPCAKTDTALLTSLVIAAYVKSHPIPVIKIDSAAVTNAYLTAHPLMPVAPDGIERDATTWYYDFNARQYFQAARIPFNWKGGFIMK